MSSRLEGTVCVITGTVELVRGSADCQALVDLALGSFGRAHVLFKLAAAPKSRSTAG